MMTPLKFYVFENIMENQEVAPFGTDAPFSVIFSKVFKALLIFLYFFFPMLSKIGKCCQPME